MSANPNADLPQKQSGRGGTEQQPRSGPCELQTPSFDQLPEAIRKLLEESFGSDAASVYANWGTYNQAVFLNTIGALLDANLNLSTAKFQSFYHGDHPDRPPFGVILSGITNQDLDQAGLKGRRIFALVSVGRRSPGNIREGSVEATTLKGGFVAFDVDLWNVVSEKGKHREEVRWNSRNNATTHPADVMRALNRRGVQTGVKCK